MGFFDSVTNFISNPVGAISDAVSSISDKFSDNPLGSMLTSLTDSTAAEGLIGSALKSLGDFNKIANTAGSIFGDDASMVSKGGMAALKSIIEQAKDSSQVAEVATKVADARQRLKTTEAVKQIVNSNLEQVFAKAQAAAAAKQYLA